MILPASYSFMDAESTCNKLGGHLASFHTEEDIAAAQQTLWIWDTESDRGLWIGLNQIGGRELENRLQYRWTDGSYLDFGIDRWDAGQPEGRSVSQCAALTTNGQFDVRPCNTEQEALCQVDGYTRMMAYTATAATASDATTASDGFESFRYLGCFHDNVNDRDLGGAHFSLDTP
eukprot:SAG31_NODE_20170_length_582_cov_0.494824_1_plen_174_part_10